jgi:hypothetical protein
MALPSPAVIAEGEAADSSAETARAQLELLATREEIRHLNAEIVRLRNEMGHREATTDR